MKKKTILGYFLALIFCFPSFAYSDTPLSCPTFKECLPLAQKGNVEAQYAVGSLYAQGKGVQQNYKEALKWYHMAAEKDNSMAQYGIGFIYERRKGDYKEAIKWYWKAAEQGNVDAIYALGYMSGQGKGVPQNDIEAYAWFNVAAAQGHHTAPTIRDALTKELSPETVAQAQELSNEYYKKYAEPFQ